MCGCKDCDELNIPIGPTGETGLTGPQGDPGTNGTNGTNGIDGTTILDSYNSTTGVGTPASILETSLYLYTIPANTIGTNDDELELYAYYEYTASDIVTLRVKLDSKIVTFTVVGVNDSLNILKIKISRITQTSQLWTIELVSKDTVSSTSVISVNSSTVDLATNLDFEITAENSTAVANQLVLKKATLYKYLV